MSIIGADKILTKEPGIKSLEEGYNALSVDQKKIFW